MPTPMYGEYHGKKSTIDSSFETMEARNEQIISNKQYKMQHPMHETYNLHMFWSLLSRNNQLLHFPSYDEHTTLNYLQPSTS